MDTTDEHFACWANCHVSIDNSWINPARLSKEVERIMKIKLEKMEQRAKENAEKLKAAFENVVEKEKEETRLKEKNERHLEAIGVLNKELKEEKETHMIDLTTQVRTHIYHSCRQKTKEVMTWDV